MDAEACRFLAKASVPQSFGAIPEARLRGLTQQQAQAQAIGASANRVKRPPGSGAPQSKVCTALFTTVPSHIIHQAPLPSHSISKSKKYSQSIFDRFPFCLMLMPIRTRNPCSGSVSCSEFGLVRSPLSYMLSV